MVELVSMIMVLIGVVAGIIVGWLIAKNRYSTELVRSQERMLAQEEAMQASKEMLHLQMSKLAKDVASQNSEDSCALPKNVLVRFNLNPERILMHVRKKLRISSNRFMKV